MATSRRSFVRALGAALGSAVGALAAGAPLAAAAGAQPDDEPTEEVKRVLRAHFGDRPLHKGHVDLTLPEDAPDGRVVPLFIESDLPMRPDDYVRAFHLIVDHNPDIYLAGFELTPALGAATIDTRIKMRRTSYVRAIAERSNGELWYAAHRVWVTLNGCG